MEYVCECVKLRESREITFESRLLTAEVHALQPLKYNHLKDFRHSRPGTSNTFSQFVMFSSCKFSKFERSDMHSKAKQSARFNSCKLEGSGGIDSSFSQ